VGGFDGSDVVGSAALGQQQKEFSMEEVSMADILVLG
jgi:hypothetical protein